MIKTFNFSKNGKFIILALFLILIAIPLFYRLDALPLREWDEARNAINAYEMSRNGNLLVKMYNGSPDLWETKPPLLVWMQAFLFILLGYTELAVRLPSALATFFMCCVMLSFFNKFLKLPWPAIIASLIIVTSYAYIGEHASRTGDHDALLCCFSMLMLLNFFRYIETWEKQALLNFSIFFVLAIYSKSITVFMFVPALIIYLVLTKNFLAFIRKKHSWFAIAGILLTVSIFYISREIASPGYLLAVWENELFPRYFNTASTYTYTRSEFLFYFHELEKWRYAAWMPYLMPAVVLNLIVCRGIFARFNFFLLISSITYFLIISKGSTNAWYDLPLIPLFAMITGLAFFNLSEMWLIILSPLHKTLLLLALLVLIFYKPYSEIMQKIMNRHETNREVQYAYVIKRIEKEFPAIRKFNVYNPPGHNYPLVFYKKVYNETKGFDIRNTELKRLNKNEYLIILDHFIKELDDSSIPYKIIFQERNTYFIKL